MAYDLGNSTIRSTADFSPADLARIQSRLKVDGKNPNDLQAIVGQAARFGMSKATGGAGMNASNAAYAKLVAEAEALGVENPNIMSTGQLNQAIASAQQAPIDTGRQQYGNATQAQLQQAQSLGIQTHGLDAKTIQEAINANQPPPVDLNANQPPPVPPGGGGTTFNLNANAGDLPPVPSSLQARTAAYKPASGHTGETINVPRETQFADTLSQPSSVTTNPLGASSFSGAGSMGAFRTHRNPGEGDSGPTQDMVWDPDSGTYVDRGDSLSPPGGSGTTFQPPPPGGSGTTFQPPPPGGSGTTSQLPPPGGTNQPPTPGAHAAGATDSGIAAGIQHFRSSGFSDDEIRSGMLAQGVSQADIDRGFAYQRPETPEERSARIRKSIEAEKQRIINEREYRRTLETDRNRTETVEPGHAATTNPPDALNYKALKLPGHAPLPPPPGKGGEQVFPVLGEDGKWRDINGVEVNQDGSQIDDGGGNQGPPQQTTTTRRVDAGDGRTIIITEVLDSSGNIISQTQRMEARPFVPPPVEPGSVTQDNPGGAPRSIGGNEPISGNFINPTTGSPTTDRSTYVSPFGTSAAPILTRPASGTPSANDPNTFVIDPVTGTGPTVIGVDPVTGLPKGFNPDINGGDSLFTDTDGNLFMKDPTSGQWIPHNASSKAAGFNASDGTYNGRRVATKRPASTYEDGSPTPWSQVPPGVQNIIETIARNTGGSIPGVGPNEGQRMEKLAQEYLDDPEAFNARYHVGGDNQVDFDSVMGDLQRRIATALSSTGTGSTEDINNLLKTYLGLQAVPQQNMFNEQFPGAFGATGDLFNMASNRATSPYNLPNVPGSKGAQFYEEGKDASDWYQNILGQASNLKTASLDTARQAIAAEVEEEYSGLSRELEASLAARGISNSTQADESRKRLTASKSRALADAELSAIERTSAVSRSNIDTLRGSVGESEGQDIKRREGEFGRDQTDYINLLNSLLTTENIAGTRLGQMQNPLSMLLSALSGVNVAPSVIPGLNTQAPPSTAQLFGQAAGNVASAVPMAIAASDKNIKHDIRPLTSDDVLERTKKLPISTWRYDDDPNTLHIGPMAQDFKSAYGVGDSDKHIHLVDASGVALASVQALAKQVEKLALR